MAGRDVFDWDRHNAEHVRNNDVEPEEAEQAVLDPARVGQDAYNVGRERRWALFGATEAGRILFVVYTWRRSRIRVVTARDAGAREKRRYRRGGR